MVRSASEPSGGQEMNSRLLSVVLALLFLADPTQSAEPPADADKGPLARQVLFIPVLGEITPKTVKDIGRQLKAKRVSGRIVVLDLDTPGGLVTAATELSGLTEAHPTMRFIAYVSGDTYGGAWSAGAYMALCCKKIYIKPGKSIGAAMLVKRSKGVTDRAKPKYEAAWAASMRGIAQKNGYPGALAEAMVLPETELWLVPGDDGPRILTGLEYKGLTKVQQAKAQQIKKKDTILALTDKEARQYGIARILRPEALAHELGLPAPEHRKFYIFWRSARRKARAVQAKKLKAKQTLTKGLADLTKKGMEIDAQTQLASLDPTRSRINAAIKRLKQYSKLANDLAALARKYPELRVSPTELDLEAKRANELKRVLEDLKKHIPKGN